LSAEAKALLDGSQTARQLLDRLLEQKLNLDAIRLLAHVLSKRDAVLWACRCVQQMAGGDPLPSARQALEATERWVADSSEDNRRSALTAAETAGFGTPAGCAAVAAFWSGGSLGPANVPVIPPGEDCTAKGVAGAILLAAVWCEPEKAPQKQHAFIALGLEIAHRAKLWN
jgi:hypothetical protein